MQLDDDDSAEEAFACAAQLPPPEIFPHQLATLDTLTEAIRARPDDAQAYLYRGELLYALGRRQEAESDWKAAISAKPSLALAHRNLAVAALQSGGERILKS